jgi:hypothetical protein
MGGIPGGLKPQTAPLGESAEAGLVQCPQNSAENFVYMVECPHFHRFLLLL